jgi:hypothetical protein
VPVGQIDQHVTDFFHEERNTPFEKIHFSWQVEWVRNIFILLNVHFIVLDQNNSSLIMILTAIIWSAKDSNHRRESLVASPTVHLVAIDLNLMGTNDRDKIVST